MEVLLHHRPCEADRLGSLLEDTRKLLEPFPCRTPPIFKPWFPSARDPWLPLRPLRPAPVLASVVTQGKGGPPPSFHPTETVAPPAPAAPEAEASPKVPLLAGTRGAWRVPPQRGPSLRTAPALSQPFLALVWRHQLHLRQRARWLVGQQHCRGRDMEQLWRALGRALQAGRLPSCNLNFQRQQGEIWVFCDVLHSEQVARCLKTHLGLSGPISLSVHRLGHIFSF